MTTPDNPTAHTPGPWTVSTLPDDTLIITAHEADGALCEPCRVNGDPTDEGCGPTTRANAWLIAAAPTLLQACKKATTCASIDTSVMALLRGAVTLATKQETVK